MTFEAALTQIKQDHQVARHNWQNLRVLRSAGNILLLTDDEYAAGDYEFDPDDYDEESVTDEFDTYLDDVGYLASSADLQATDWYVIA
ncbi:Thoeris anti-defense Tad2 family protein [Levilactobacillus cerevisiae]|uniref:Thoeris anti-defense Tad2 family protein n=1 Tax=Levilactobacillus cerevisiae TaxID=1704076 RepID=UPI000F78655B|nr:MW1434 family type I TA system toxin [Levilactobacillus cerevisiae]